MTGEVDLLSSKFFWKNIHFSGLFREKHILFIPMIQGKTVLFLKNSGKNIPKNVYEPCYPGPTLLQFCLKGNNKYISVSKMVVQCRS